jgi:hypothetical protein
MNKFQQYTLQEVDSCLLYNQSRYMFRLSAILRTLHSFVKITEDHKDSEMLK